MTDGQQKYVQHIREEAVCILGLPVNQPLVHDDVSRFCQLLLDRTQNPIFRQMVHLTAELAHDYVNSSGWLDHQKHSSAHLVVEDGEEDW